MKKLVLVVCLGLSITLICGCQKSTNNVSTTTTNNRGSIKEDSMEEFTTKINIIIHDKTFSVTLEYNETSREFIKRLPLNITMNELNGNEKYYYFDHSLPNNSTKVGKIASGDIMLYSNDCFVLFYDSFHTNYSYTRIGKLDNPEELKNLVGNGNIDVYISK